MGQNTVQAELVPSEPALWIRVNSKKSQATKLDKKKGLWMTTVTGTRSLTLR